MKKLTKIMVALGLIFSSLYYLCSSFAYKKNNNQEIIDQVMAYQMPDIIERCQKDFKYTNEDMQLLEKEFKRFLILCIIFKDSNIGMYSNDIDNLWHSFILFTKEYALFCDQCNGQFIHHVPTLEKDKTPEKRIESKKYFQEFIKNYEEIFNEEIHPLWFLDMCEEK
jgi:hypothetical protein